ncbi:hypothetical protein EDB84DRAFT_1277603, partial [Lactarius hengduanensis]
LFQCRCEIAKFYSPLTKHLGLLDTLGVNGMSSDESAVDADTTQVTYTIVKPSWQHSLLHNWLKVFDQLDHQNHINSWSTDKHGAFAHIRTVVLAPTKFMKQYTHLHISQSMPMTPSGSKAGRPFT